METASGSRSTAPSDDDARYKGLLEKKWTSVIRLQKKAILSISVLKT